MSTAPKTVIPVPRDPDPAALEATARAALAGLGDLTEIDHRDLAEQTRLVGLDVRWSPALGVSIHLPIATTPALARAAAAGVRAALLDPGPWVPLRELRPGALFELKSGDVGVKRAEPAVDPDRVRVVYTARGEDAQPLGSVLARLTEQPARELLTRVVREWEENEIGALDGAVVIEARALLGLAAAPDPLAVPPTEVTLAAAGERPALTLRVWPKGGAFIGVDASGRLWQCPTSTDFHPALGAVSPVVAHEGDDFWILDAVRALEALGAVPAGSSWRVHEGGVVVFQGPPPASPPGV